MDLKVATNDDESIACIDIKCHRNLYFEPKVFIKLCCVKKLKNVNSFFAVQNLKMALKKANILQHTEATSN